MIITYRTNLRKEWKLENKFENKKLTLPGLSADNSFTTKNEAFIYIS